MSTFRYRFLVPMPKLAAELFQNSTKSQKNHAKYKDDTVCRSVLINEGLVAHKLFG